MQKTGADRERVLELLTEMGGVTEDNVREIAKITRVSEAEIWGAGTFYHLINKPGKRVRVCNGLTCRLFGAEEVIDKLRAQGKEVEVASCLGQCDRAPAALDENLKVIDWAKQPRSITPDNPALPMNLAGTQDFAFKALDAARAMTPDQIFKALEESGLQGRGGAGFPAHIKWKGVASQKDPVRYVVCNADEAEPATFKDRETMLRRPDKLIEGMAIAAHAVGAKEVYFYIRGEFNAEYEAVKAALHKAPESIHNLDWHFHRGHGAYICGEETALLESMEGKRGMPRLKPPFPHEFGFRGKPTLISNVETFACVPYIITHGGAKFKAHGRTEAGSKLYCISGHVNKPGVYELSLGATLDELVAAAGGYMGTPMAFSPGGASSGFLPIEKRDQPLDFKGLQKAGTMLGSAGVVVLNDTVDMAKAAQWQLEFFEVESCGQCAPCRIGTRYLHNQVGKYLKTGDPGALKHANDVGWEMEEGSICGLGMVAHKPLVDALKYFPKAFEKRQSKPIA
ncbi:MAG: SLBB domain-containing protein [Planctomycetes bacterium]|nr:SLBB domain-containing protein [Planctomycetota bacterium]MCW8134321.1 SLBB domain-containing protein [Planctomycetota bacterium]